MKNTNEVMQAICSRRSVKQYTEEPVAAEQLKAVLTAGQYAANGRSLMATKFVVVQNKAVRDQLAAMNAAVMGAEMDPFYGAPVVIWVLADRTIHTHVEDGSLAIGNMLLAAHSLGLGSCWIHRAKEMSEHPEGRALLREWGVPEEYIGVGCCILGHAAGTIREPKPRKEDQIVFVK